MRQRPSSRSLVDQLKQQWSEQRWVDRSLVAEAEARARGYRAAPLRSHWLAEVHAVAALGDLRAERISEALRRGRELHRLVWRLPGTPLRILAHLRSRRVERLVGSVERAVMLEREHDFIWDPRFGPALEIEDALERAALRESLGEGDAALRLTCSISAVARGVPLSAWVDDEMRIEWLRRRSRSPFEQRPTVDEAHPVRIPCPSGAAELDLPSPPPRGAGRAQRLHGLTLRILTAARRRASFHEAAREAVADELEEAPASRLTLAIGAFLDAGEPHRAEATDLQRWVLQAGPFRFGGLVGDEVPHLAAVEAAVRGPRSMR